MKLAAILIFLTCSINMHTYAQLHENDIIGHWLTEENDAGVKVYKKDGAFYGKIFWIKDGIDENGKPRLDKKNPDQSKKSKPILNMEFMKEFQFDAKQKEWKNGNIYDAKSGKTYSGYIKMDSKDILMMRGYVGVSLLGRTTEWTRLPDKKKK